MQTRAVTDDGDGGFTRVRVLSQRLRDDRVVSVGVATSPLDAVRRRLLEVVLLAAPVLLTLLTLGGRLVVRAALRPGDVLTREAAAISSFEQDRALPPVLGDDEIARLAATLAGMLTRGDSRCGAPTDTRTAPATGGAVLGWTQPLQGGPMPVRLNHTIVAARDKHGSATFLADLLGRTPPTTFGPFSVVELDNDVSLDFLEEDPVVPRHYAFLVTEEEFDAIFGRIRARGLDFWADPFERRPGEINHNDGGRGVYWNDPNGHKLEIITRPYGG